MPNPVVHFEVTGKDLDKAHAFYRDMFDWKIQPMPEMSYGTVDTGGAGVNGGIGADPEGKRVFVTFYVEVDDPQAYLDKAVSLGGTVVMPVMEIPDVVTMAQFADPDGNVIGLVKS